MINKKNIKIGIIGLGYVGLPLAIEFGKIFKVYGFDISKERVNQLSIYEDVNSELSKDEIKSAEFLSFCKSSKELKKCNFFIITVPTPVKKNKEPDLQPLIEATQTVAQNLKLKDIVVYESTVYPGCTEEICIPILEKKSKLKFNIDFFCGYSPERINPGDKEKKINDIVKVVSGSNAEVLKFISKIYKKIIKAGIHEVDTIKIAEASKLIENAQRDVNIGLMNEFATILNKMEINTSKVLEAANTKWNFLNFKPGLVGGHCIGVDSYYLINKSEQNQITPNIVKSAREVNENMGYYIGKSFLKKLLFNNVLNNRVLIFGYTFKENISDIRNTKVSDIVNYLIKNNVKVSIYDPWLTNENKIALKNFEIIDEFPDHLFNGIIIAVAHEKFRKIGLKKIKQLAYPNSPIYDVKSLFLSSADDEIMYL